MKFLQTENQKKALAITISVFVALFLLFIFYKITDVEKEPSFMGGEIAINFGNSNVGKGNIRPIEPIETKSSPIKTSPAKAVDQKIVTQTKVETTVVKTSDKIDKNKDAVPKATPKKEPTPSKSTEDALSNLINGPKKSGENSGYGDDQEAGNKGKISGSMYANSFYGDGSGNGSGSGTSWGLNGRSLSSSKKIVQNCNEEGTVVVQIRVNRSGNVISAQQAKGTTNSAKCLTDAAIATAKTFRWRSDDKAPQEQIGFIVVKFSLN